MSNALWDEQAHISGWPSVGQDEETLKDYGLDHAKVIRAAERTQERTNSFKPRGLHGLSSLFQDVIDNPGSSVLDDLKYFNIPVCDLDSLGDLYVPGNCEFPEAGPDLPKKCVAVIVADSCSKLRLGESEWPYHYTA